MNALYALPRELLLKAALNWPTLAIYIQAWRGSYAFNEAHVTSADVTAAGGALVQTSLAATGAVVRPGGYGRTDPILLPTVPASPNPITFLTLSEITTLPGTHRLILFIDEAEGLPFVPNGLDQPVQPDWLNARGWFRP